MNNFMLTNFLLLMPEIGILALSIFVLIIGLFTNVSSRASLYVGVIGTIILTYFYYTYFAELNGDMFEKAYVINHTSYVIKSILLFLLSFYLLSYIGYSRAVSRKYDYEYLFIVLVSILGGLIIISSSNFIPLYLGIELTSLSSYILAAFNRDDLKSSEAGLKYFTLGSFASCLILFGLSLIYGVSGSLDFAIVNSALQINPNILIICSSILLLGGVLFKISAVPFHFWTPDVYLGSPLLSVMLFSSISKIPALFLATLVITKIMQPIGYIYINIMEIVIIASLLVGSIGAVMQKSIKKLMAYSTILNIGFALIGVIASPDGADKSMIYILIYSVTIIGFFTILYMLLGEKAENATIYDLQGLARFKKFGAIAIAIIMFSLIGIPPFAGFFAKYIILYEALKAKFYLLFAIGLLSALIAAYYYLKIISMLYFSKSNIANRIPISGNSMIVGIISVIFVILFSVLPVKHLLGYNVYSYDLNLHNHTTLNLSK